MSHTKDDLRRFIVGMPKFEYHCHLEGTLEATMAFKFAERQGMLPLSIPKSGGGTYGGTYTIHTLSELEKVYEFEDLLSFLNIYNTLATTLRTSDELAELATAWGNKAIEQNVRHAEVFCDPQTHLVRGLSFKETIDGIQRGFDVCRERGLSVGLICCILRDHAVGQPSTEVDINNKSLNLDTSSGWNMVEQAVEYNKQCPEGWKIWGIGMDNAEVGFPPSLFTDVYSFARQHGLKCTAHAGEEGPPDYMWQALNLLNVSRIDHGVRCTEDPALVKHLAEAQTAPHIVHDYGCSHHIPLTVCPRSNWKLCVFKDPRTSTLLKMLDLGIQACVNSDDPAYFGGYMHENFMFLLDTLSEDVPSGRCLKFEDLVVLMRNGIDAGWISQDKKDAYHREANAYLEQFLKSAHA